MGSPVWDETCHTGEVMAVALESPRGLGAGTGCVGAGWRRGAAVAAPAALGGDASRYACRAVVGSLSTGLATPGTACPTPSATGLGLAAKVSLAQRWRVHRAWPALRRRGWALPRVGVWVGQRTFPGEAGTPVRPPPPQLQQRRRRRRSWKRSPHCCSRAAEVWAGGRPLGASPATAGRCCSTARRGRSQPRAQPRAWKRRGL